MIATYEDGLEIRMREGDKGMLWVGTEGWVDLADEGQITAHPAALLEDINTLSVKEDIGRVLWQIGSAQSAPALKGLLAQPETVAIACYAIADNPAPELGQADREALRGSSGKVAASLLNLLGQRRDKEAVGLIVPFLKNGPEVSAAAVAALELILPSLDGPAAQAEAAVAAIEVASNLGPGNDAVVIAAMKKVLAVAPNADLPSQAQTLLRALERRPMYMRDWVAKLDDFLRLSDRDLLTHAGKVSHEAALAKAEAEYEKFRLLEANQPSAVETDFRKALRQLEGETKRLGAAPISTARTGPRAATKRGGVSCGRK